MSTLSNTPNNFPKSQLTIESVSTHLTEAQKIELRNAYQKAIQQNANKRLETLKAELSDDTEKILSEKSPGWEAIVEQQSEKGILDRVEKIPVIGGIVSVIRSPVDTAEWVWDKILSATGADANFVVNNNISTVFKEKWVWEGIKYIFSQIQEIFSAGISLDAFSRVMDLLKGDMNTGKKVSELVGYYDKLLDLSMADEAIWKNAMLDKKLLDIPLAKMRSHMNDENILKSLQLEKISHGDVKEFLKKFFDATNFEKIISDYKAKSSATHIDENTITLKDVFLKIIENPSK